MKKWVHKGYKTIEEAIAQRFSAQELLFPRAGFADEIPGLTEAAHKILEAVELGQKITIVGDYDADGTCATAILFLTLKHIKAQVEPRIPHRLSEGYGISPTIIDEIKEKQQEGLIITVDNGITAHAAIERAKEYGFSVVVIDHHLPAETLPPADVIVDPKVNAGKGYADYCGAGLAYKLAQYILSLDNAPETETLLEHLTALAATATIADVMPLSGDNRIIVKKGLACINEQKVYGGLQSIVDVCRLSNVKAEDIGYKIAPIINAPGRLIDDGARLSCAVLAAVKPTPKNAQKLYDINEQRKTLVQACFEEISKKLSEDNQSILIVFDRSIQEGIAGILAGRLVDAYGLPAIVFAANESGWKGSARSVESVNLKEALDTTAALLAQKDEKAAQTFQYGGHAGAAGARLGFGFENQFIDCAQKVFSDYHIGASDSIMYDVVISQEQLPAAYMEQVKFEPFGEGCSKPLVRVNALDVSQAIKMGAQKQHFRFQLANGVKFLGFNMAAELDAVPQGQKIDVLGQLSFSDTQWGKEVQFVIRNLAVSSNE